MKIYKVSIIIVMILGIFGLFSFHSYSENADKTKALITELPNRQFFFELSGGQELENFEDEVWTSLKNGKISYKKEESSIYTLSVNAAFASEKSINFMRTFEGIGLNSNSEMRFGITISGEAGASYGVSVILSTESEKKEYYAELKNGCYYEMILDLTNFEEREIKEIEFLAKGEDSFISCVTITPLRLSEDYQSTIYENFSSRQISGDFKYNRDKNTLSLSNSFERHTVSLKSDLYFDSDLSCSGGGVIALEIDSSVTGTISVNINAGNDEKGSSYSCGTKTLVNNKKYYFFNFSPLSLPKSYQITITSDLSEDSLIDIESVKLYSYQKSDFTYNRTAGSIPKITLVKEQNVLTVEGTLTRQSIIDNIDGNILLFKIPLWENDYEALNSEPYLSTRVSSKYQFTIPLDLTPDVLLSRYIVAVSCNGKITPIYKSQYPSILQSNVEIPKKTLIASSGMNEKDFIKSGCDKVYLNLSLEKLQDADNSNGGKLVSWNKKYYYLNSDMIKDLAYKLTFLRNSKTEIYIGFTDPADYFCDISEERFTYIFAVCSYLLDNYEFISGFAISDGLSISESDMHFSNAVISRDYLSDSISSYISSYAEAIHAIYALGSSRSNKFNIEARIKNNDGYELSGFILSEMMSEIGNTSWSLIFTPSQNSVSLENKNIFSVDSLEESLSLASYIKEIQNSGFRGIILHYDISYEEISSEIKAFYNLLSENNFLAVYLEFTKTDSDVPVFYVPDEGYVYDKIPLTPKGAAVIWDFSSSYSTHGWINDSTSRLSNTANKFDKENSARVLHAEISSSGLMMYNFNKPVNFSAVQCFCLKGSTEHGGKFTVVFVSQNSSISFECNVEAGTFNKYLDFNSFSGLSEIYTITIYSDSGITLNFSNIEILSNDKTQNELFELITPTEITEQKKEFENTEIFDKSLRLSIITVCISMAAFIFFSRHKKRKESTN